MARRVIKATPRVGHNRNNGHKPHNLRSLSEQIKAQAMLLAKLLNRALPLDPDSEPLLPSFRDSKDFRPRTDKAIKLISTDPQKALNMLKDLHMGLRRVLAAYFQGSVQRYNGNIDYYIRQGGSQKRGIPKQYFDKAKEAVDAIEAYARDRQLDAYGDFSKASELQWKAEKAIAEALQAYEDFLEERAARVEADVEASRWANAKHHEVKQEEFVKLTEELVELFAE